MCTKSICSSLIFMICLGLNSCEDSKVSNYEGDHYYFGGVGGDSIPYQIVTDNPTSIVSFTDLSTFQRGAKLKLRVNRRDFEVWEVGVTFDALYISGRDRLILCHTQAGFPIGAGDSGSPLLTSDGKVVGILAYGYYGNSTDFGARVIEDVLAIDSSATPLTSPPPSFYAIEPAYVVTGYDPNMPSRYAELASHFGINATKADNPLIRGNGLQKSGDFPVVPGTSIAVVDMSGDYFDWIAVGTMSYMREDRYYAFGHSFNPYLAAPTYVATTGSFIVSNDVSFKMSQPEDQLVGAFTKNDYRGILIEKDVTPLVANLTTTCSANGQQLFSYHHQMSNTHSFSSDRSWAMYISGYFIYLGARSVGKQNDTLRAVCTATAASELETKTKSFTLYDRWVDWRVYQYCYDSLQLNTTSKELKKFELSVDLNY